MKRIALLFPGQGVDLALAPLLVSGAARVRATIERAAPELLDPLQRGGPKLTRTEILQPAVTALCLGVVSELEAAGVAPFVCAGHSLGELAALGASGAFSTEQATRLASTRGRLMAREASAHPGGMLALTEADENVVRAALELGRSRGQLVLAAHNAPDEWVVSGDELAIGIVAARFRSVRLDVRGPWHSPAMAGAVPEFRAELEAAATRELSTRFVANATAEVLTHAAPAAPLLARQLSEPLDWVRVLERIFALEISHFVTIGPGKLLRNLLQRTLGRELSVLSTGSPFELAQTLKELAP